VGLAAADRPRRGSASAGDDALAVTVVKAMHLHALGAFCISTDATGVCVQPIPSHEKGRQPCKKGHFLAMLADRDHVLFEYLEKENGKTIHALFRGYSGYVQADAKSVFNLVFADAGELEKKAPHSGLGNLSRRGRQL
jgi:hypothetical protein